MDRHLALALVILAPGLGCDDRPPSGALVQYDSAGIQIVESVSPLWGASEGWVLDSLPILEIGDDPDDPSQQLYGVGDVLPLEDGRLVVVNEGLVNVLLFDSLGGFLGAVGQKGPGPGEFQRVEGVYRCPGDTIVVNDFSRVSHFDPEAGFIRSERIVPLPGDDAVLRVLGVSADCSRYLLRGGYQIPEMGKVGRVSYTLSWGTLDNAVRDSIPGEVGWEAETKAEGGGAQPLPLLWGAGAKWTVGGDRVYLGIGDRPEIRVFDESGGLIRLVRWREDPHPVTATDHTSYSERRQKAFERYPQVAGAFPPRDEYAMVPQDKPYLLSLLTDDEGNLWVREYPATVAGRPSLFDYSNPDAPLRENPAPDEDPEVWKVFDLSGQWLGTVEVPADLAVRSVNKDRLFAVWRDDFDVERVRVYRLRKP